MVVEYRDRKSPLPPRRTRIPLTQNSKPMTSRYVFLLIFFLFFFFSPSLASSLNPFDSNNTHILKDVLKVIALKQKWDLERINLSKLEVSKARLGVGRRYEFRVRFGKTHLLFKFPDEVGSWKKLRKEAGNDFVNSVTEFSSKAALDSFKLEGPFDLRLSGSDEASLSLPLNTSQTGLKRILVGEGITVEVSGAQEVSLFQAFNGATMNMRPAKERSTFFPVGQSWCMPLIPIHVSGSVSLVAYHARNPGAHIETLLTSKDGIELLPEKCYSSWINWQLASPISSLNPNIVRLEKIMDSILGNKNGSFGSVNVKSKASSITRFQLELERDIARNESRHVTLAEWRTRPSVEQVWFEVTARVEEQRLQPLVIKKVRPFSLVDSSSWSSLMSNVSFTKFPSIFVPPEALTLDVKW